MCNSDILLTVEWIETAIIIHDLTVTVLKKWTNYSILWGYMEFQALDAAASF